MTLLQSISPSSLTAGSSLGVQQLNLSLVTKPSIGASIFPPQNQTVAGATQPPLAAFSASVLTAVLPTNQAPEVTSPFSTTPVTQPGQPTAPGSNEFSAQYAPEIYAVYLNGLIASTTVQSGTVLATNTWTVDVAHPPISGDPAQEIPGAPPAIPVPAAEGTDLVISSISSLAGTGRIFTPAPSAPAQTVAAGTGAPQSSAASRSQSHVAKT